MKYILIDISNGDAREITEHASKVFFWMFDTKKKAMEFRDSSNSRLYTARLIGPFRLESLCGNLRNGKYCRLERVQ